MCTLVSKAAIPFLEVTSKNNILNWKMSFTYFQTDYRSDSYLRDTSAPQAACVWACLWDVIELHTRVPGTLHLLFSNNSW